MMGQFAATVLLWGLIRMFATKQLFAAALMVVINLASVAFADQIQDDLQTAKKKHDQAVTTAKDLLDKAFLSRIKDAAQKEDLTTIKALIAEKELFDADGTLPTHPLLTEEVIRYIGSRRSSASATYLVYQNSIQAYVGTNQLDAAKKLEAESTHFTEAEQTSISLNKRSKAKPDAPEIEKAIDVKATVATKDRLAEFFSSYEKMLQEIASQSTTVKQEEVHRTLAKKLDENIKNQTWEFHCRINDIKQSNGGRFVISHEFPIEYSNPEQQWTGRTSATVTLTQQEALALKPGDYVIYTGTPRFLIGQGANTEYFQRTEEIAGHYTYHCLHLTNVKVRYQKDVDAKDDEMPVVQRGKINNKRSSN